MKNIVIMKAGNYRQNLFKDQLGLIRDRIDGQAEIDLHSGTGGKLVLGKYPDGIKLTTDGLGSELTTSLDLSFIDGKSRLYLWGSAIPVVPYDDSGVYTPEQVVRYAEMFYLDMKTNSVKHVSTDEPIDNSKVFIIPLATVSALMDTPIYVFSVNSDVIFIANSLFESDENTIVRETWGIDSSTQTISDALFNPKVSGDFVEVTGVRFMSPGPVTIRLGEAAALLGTELNFNSDKMSIKASVPFKVDDSGEYITFDFTNQPAHSLHYVKIGLAYYRPIKEYMSNLKDLPEVDFLFSIT